MVSSTARLAAFHAPGTPFVIETRERPALRPGEVLVRVTTCTLCGSDLHSQAGHRVVAVPTVLGHEIVGTIERIGWTEGVPMADAEGRVLCEGDRVVWAIVAHCGTCTYCRDDLPQKCEHGFKYGHEPMRGEHAFAGGLAEVCHLAEGTTLYRVPDALPDVVAAPATCATATVVAAFHDAKVQRGVVVVIGAGMLGLTACALAKVQGARHVVLVDVDPVRLARGERFGADSTIQVGAGLDVREHVSALSDGRLADAVFEMSGAAPAVSSSLVLARTGGTVTWVGAVSPTPAVLVVPQDVVRRCLTVRGVHNYHPRDLGQALRFLEKNHARFPFAELVSTPFALDAVDDAFEEARTGAFLRVAVQP
ncbi:MAG: zinc-binding dehydrogenase [Planctomycetes bacterium]|nr:zinc-binding dehydrogenase [Planctomycetota bacterium]